MERILPARSGVPTASVSDRFLHSAYDPDKEARRFAESLQPMGPGTMLVLLGEGLGYLSIRVRSLYPDAVVLSVYFSEYLFQNRITSKESDVDSSWHPESSESFSAFLRRRISDLSFPGLRVAEWAPAAEAYPDFMRLIKEQITQFGREVNGSLLTTRVFGKKWIKNSIRNYLDLGSLWRLLELSGPVLIAASGPGLEDSLPFLSEYRERFTLWALPSAIDFLYRHGHRPDGIFMTDPGFYTGLHFHGLLRRGGKGEAPVFMPLSAFAGLRRTALPFAVFHQGTAIETLLLDGLLPAGGFIPSNGTVAGTAVETALSAGSGPVIAAGLDFSCRGWREHARPNAFDSIIETSGGRFSPQESLLFRRMELLYPDRLPHGFRSSPSLRTYAGWFRSREKKWQGRVFRLFPSPVDAGPAEAPDPSRLFSGSLPLCRFESVRLPDRSEKTGRVRGFIAELEKFAGGPGLPDASPEMIEILLMIETAGMLDLEKNRGGPAEKSCREAIRAGVRDFAASLRALLRSTG